VKYRAITQEEADQLPAGTAIRVMWNGGNGPYDYQIAVNSGGLRTIVSADARFHRAFVGFISQARTIEVVTAGA